MLGLKIPVLGLQATYGLDVGFVKVWQTVTVVRWSPLDQLFQINILRVVRS